jgi:hypothetical protein
MLRVIYSDVMLCVFMASVVAPRYDMDRLLALHTNVQLA